MGVAGHSAWNAELLRRIPEEDVDLDGRRLDDVFFRAPDEDSADSLVHSLARDRLEGFFSAPLREEGEAWSVKGRLRLSPRRMADDEFTEKLVRLAAECEATYDGWGTSL